MADEPLLNILWIDDEHEELTSTKGRAKNNGLKLHAFKSRKAGIKELQSNQDFYDGVLLDARCFENENDSKGTEDTQHSIDALADIRALDKKFEIFVLTGQSEDQIDGSYKKIFKNVYEKGNNDHFKELVQRLKENAFKLADTQLKHKYDSVFRLANEGLLSAKNHIRVLDLVKYLENEKDLDDNELTPIRKVIENVFSYLKDIGLVPVELVHGPGAINKTSRFLATLDDNYIYHEEPIPRLQSECLHRLLNLTQDGAHGDGSLRLEVDNYLTSSSYDYLFKSAVFLLFDILSWFGENIQTHSNAEANSSKWERKEGHGVEISGTVARIENEWGTFESTTGQTRCSIPPGMMNDHNLSLHQEIVITTKPDPTNEANIHIDTILNTCSQAN